MQRLFVCLTLAAIAIPTFPVLVEAQTRTGIGELQQRARGTTISGKVVSVVGNDFTLNDGTGQIIVDAGPRWWRQIDIRPGEEVTVTGEISKKVANLMPLQLTALTVLQLKFVLRKVRRLGLAVPRASAPNQRPAPAPSHHKTPQAPNLAPSL